MLMEHLVRRRIDHAMLPIRAVKVLLSLIPQEGVSLASHRMDHHTVHMPVAFLVGSGRNLRTVAADGPLAEDETDAGAAGAARRHRLQFEIGEIGEKIYRTFSCLYTALQNHPRIS